jgi:hypothetical protein
MKTAVEQLERQILDNWMDILIGKVYIGDLFDQAKEMEKEQIVNAHYQGYRPSIGTTEISEKYFNETFKSE